MSEKIQEIQKSNRGKQPRTYNNNPFCQALLINAKGLTNDKTLKMRWEKMPAGAAAGYDFGKNVIIMPEINSVEITQEHADKLKALSYHERLHHALTDGKVVIKLVENYQKEMKSLKKKNDAFETVKYQMKTKFRKDFLNFLEDARIEMNEHYRLTGDLEDLHYFQTTLARRDYFKNWRELQEQNPFGALMMAIKYTLPGYQDLEIIPTLKDYWDAAMEILNDGRYEKSLSMKHDGTQVMLDLADEIIEKWQQVFDNDDNMEMKTISVYQEGEGEGEGEGETEGEGEGEGEGESEGEGEESSDDSKSKGKSKDGKSKSGKNGKAKTIQEKYNSDNEKGEGAFEIDPDALSKEMAGLSSDGESEFDDTNYETRGNPHAHGIEDNTPYIPYSVMDRTIVAGKFPNEYNQIKSDISDRINRTRSILTRLLMAQAQERTLNRQRRGHIDRRRLHNVVRNSPGFDRVFLKHQNSQKLSTAIQLVIDLSGSMECSATGKINRAELAAQIATLFGETLHTLKIPFEIIGYNTDGMPREVSKEAARQGFTRVGDVVNRWVFKTFDENFPHVSDRLGACSLRMPRQSWDYDEDYANTEYRSKNGCVGGCNVDHEVIQWGAARLWARKETRKLQIVLADGQPSGYNGTYGGQLHDLLKQVNDKIEASGIEQFCFGIQCDGVKRYYRRNKVINDLSEMTEETLKLLATNLGYNPVAK